MKQPAESNLATYVKLRCADIEEAMSRHFSLDEHGGPSVQDADMARRLVGFLIEVMCGRADGLSDEIVEAVPFDYLSKFGDGLVPILNDVIAREVPPALLSQAIDGYWRAISTNWSR
ncbi:hypothetical protein [Novosphingobium sp. JCM 18896]|uniref:hypothetical protein n=1 Tax=Novosphingobium sp. JCM 18896 TaxID=2989731 RepID=UPI002222DDCF|nr:hypothetical protein [Novosphingobium sp. JCM 18896]MCW1432053.1 hypothetical protein [Novosphingobium sp. JCM 18896]